MKRTAAKTAGFTLVELMMSVAIIGLLASTALPSYDKFKRKAIQAEAKVNLANLYTAEKSFHADWQTFTTRLDTMTFRPDGRTYYNYGFGGDIDLTTFPAGAPRGADPPIMQTCPSGVGGNWPSQTWICTPASSRNVDAGFASTASRDTFRACAHIHWKGIHAAFTGNWAAEVDGPPAESFSIEETKRITYWAPGVADGYGVAE